MTNLSSNQFLIVWCRVLKFEFVSNFEFRYSSFETVRISRGVNGPEVMGIFGSRSVRACRGATVPQRSHESRR